MHASSYRSVAAAPSARNSRAISIASSLAYSVTAIRAFAQYAVASRASSSSSPSRARARASSRGVAFAAVSLDDARVAVVAAVSRASLRASSRASSSSSVTSSLNVGLGGSVAMTPVRVGTRRRMRE